MSDITLSDITMRRCSGWNGKWACEEEYPDHYVPMNQFGTDNGKDDGLHHWCKACNTMRNDSRPRHPETGQLKVNWLSDRAIELYGGNPKSRRTDQRWKDCYAQAKAEAKSIEWFVPSEGCTVIPFPAKPEFTNDFQEVTTTTTARRRDRKVVDAVKEKYSQCAVEGCDYPLFDVAHIHALKHGADDLPGNCIPLCPNHHRDLDRGRLLLADPSDRSAADPIEFLMNGEVGRIILNEGHEVDNQYINGCIHEIEAWIAKNEVY